MVADFGSDAKKQYSLSEYLNLFNKYLASIDIESAESEYKQALNALNNSKDTQKIDQLIKEVKRLKADNTKKAKDLQTIAGKIKESNKEVSVATNALKDAKTDLSKLLADKNADINNDISYVNAKNNFEKLEKNLKSKKDSLAEAKKVYDRILKAGNKEELIKSYKSSKENLEKATKAKEDNQKVLDNKKALDANLAQKVKDLNSELTDLSKKSKGLKANLDRDIKAYNESKAIYDEFVKENEEYYKNSKKLEDSKKALEESNKNIENLKANISKADKNIKDLEEKILEAKSIKDDADKLSRENLGEGHDDIKKLIEEVKVLDEIIKSEEEKLGEKKAELEKIEKEYQDIKGIYDLIAKKDTPNKGDTNKIAENKKSRKAHNNKKVKKIKEVIVKENKSDNVKTGVVSASSIIATLTASAAGLFISKKRK